eukprot:CAMPEP_0113899284 /NCGR_PEP_ID=MMETSP0780_2-20120614/19921_1 /TAXON_ID=652834 /ORGANISM="Palpitomonas bilix" /LENGTH=236 /DNA_ID=CAMNT_0000891385 /DNA_START=227 /DNA_END=933 /DNA_ORIENTATION=+ /assembly_acc=CAM_ASM_000599
MSDYDMMMRGGKTGSGGIMSKEQSNLDRKERLKRLALETIDITKDPYFMKNNVGQCECKLCLTVHNNEANYLAHTQGQRHQRNLARRAAKEAKMKETSSMPLDTMQKPVMPKTIKIGRPGYKVTKQRDSATGQLSLLFQVEYPEIEENLQPRHRFMSAFEQKIEAKDSQFQYLLVAAEPYETVAFKIPSWEVDRGEGKFFTHWEYKRKIFSVQIHFKNRNDKGVPPLPMDPPPLPT